MSLQRIQKLAWLLDNSIPIPGTRIRIGLDPIIGLIPGIGDVAGGVFSAYIVIEAARLGASNNTLFRMCWNVLIEVVFGTIPVLGDIFDAGWKGNAKNISLLERHLGDRTLARQRDRGFIVVLASGLLLVLVAALSTSFLVLRWLFRL
ncbi:MAG: DUF4112 domain-containing protein [Gemmatimonadota bacterium]